MVRIFGLMLTVILLNAVRLKKDVFKIGRIDKKEIIIQGNNHKEFTEYRERMLKMCKDCFIFNICAGGCPEKMLRDKHGEFINQRDRLNAYT